MATNRGYGPKVKQALYGLYGGTLSDPPPCHRCGQPAESVDHIVPHALGGSDELDNLRPACLSCNAKDGARLGNHLKKRKPPGGLTHNPLVKSRPAKSVTGDGVWGAFFGDPPKAPTHPLGKIPPKAPETAQNGVMPSEREIFGRDLPRLATPDPGNFGDGPLLIELADRLELPLMPWQQYAADRLTRDGIRTALVSVARQNGKSYLLRALVAHWLINRAANDGPQTVVLAANSRNLAVDQWQSIIRTFEQHLPGAIEKVSRGAGRERLTMVDGSTFEPVAATDSIHGRSVDLFLVDEVWDIKSTVLDDGILPTTIARPKPLVAMFSTAGDENSHAMRAWRENGITDIDAGTSGSHLFLEWSPPDDASEDDPETWAYSNPGLGRTVTLEALEAASKRPNRQAFIRAHLNRWVSVVDAWLPVGHWQRLENHPEPADYDPDRFPVVAIEQDKTTGAFAIVTARPLKSKRVHVTAYSVKKEAELWEALRPRVEAGDVVLLPPLMPERASFDLPDTVRVVGNREIKAWAAFVEQAILTGVVSHSGDVQLSEQLGRTTTRLTREGNLTLGTAVPGASVHAVRAMVWAVAEATRLEKPAPAPVIAFG